MPTRKPKDLKILHGTYRECEQPKQKVDPKGKPRKPKGLDKDASWFWDMVCCDRSEWVSKSDAAALRVVCELWSHLRRLQNNLTEDPAHYKSLIGYQMVCKLWHTQASKFGLDPLSRERLGDTKPADTVDEQANRWLA